MYRRRWKDSEEERLDEYRQYLGKEEEREMLKEAIGEFDLEDFRRFCEDKEGRFINSCYNPYEQTFKLKNVTLTLKAASRLVESK